MSMGRVFSCVVGRGYLLWPVCFLGKTLLAFALVHSVLRGQICLLLQVSLDFCHSLLQWTTFYQNSPPWPICLGWPYMAWLIVSLSKTRLWSMWSDWLVFFECGFQPVCPLMEKDKRLMEAFWWERLTESLALMGRAMLSKSLIQFFVEGRAVFPPGYLTWGQTMVEVMKIMATSFKRSHAHLNSM